MRALSTVALAGCLLLAGCQEDGHNTSKSEQPVTVPVTRDAILDDTYVTADTASIHNEDYGNASYGVVTLSARRGRGESNETPVLSVFAKSSTGGSIKCHMARSVIWSSSTGLMDLDLKCDKRLDLASITGVTLPD